MSVAYEKELQSCQGVTANRPFDLWDHTGLATSLICIVHCLATPFILVSLPALGEWFASPWVHRILAIFVVAAAAGSLAPGYWLHRRWLVLVPAVLGAVLVLYAAFGTWCCGGEETWGTLFSGAQLSIGGGICLIIAHGFNLWNGTACTCR